MSKEYMYIEQSVVEESLFNDLQQITLKELQRLSGKVWTNFNVHDPGVTTSDILNYVLSELYYKLGFDLIDYLLSEHERFEPEEYGMYIPEKVYPTTPVTLKDYRKLLLSHFPTLTDIIIELKSDLQLEIRYVPSPINDIDKLSPIINDMTDLFNSNRNLCEKLGSVTLCERKMLYLHSEIEVRAKEDMTTVLAQVYWNILSYLSGGFYFEKFENLLDDNFNWEEWFEGPVLERQLIFPQQANTMSELHEILCSIEGVKEFKTCYLAQSLNDLKNIISDFKIGYSLFVPTAKADLRMKIRIGGDEVELTELDFNDFIDKFKTLYLLNRSSSDSDDKIELSREFMPAGLYRYVYDHQIIAKDFPLCYNVSIPLSEKNCNKQFYSYLKLFDLVLMRGLKELSEMKNLLSIKANGTTLSKVKLTTSSMGIDVLDIDKYRNVFVVKSQYLDFLDHLYGVESNLAWTRWGSVETEEDILKLRMNFLQNVPWLLKNRSRAYNIYKPCSIENIPTIKAHLSLLLGMNMNENISSRNIFSKFKLKLVESECGVDRSNGFMLGITSEELGDSLNWINEPIGENMEQEENREEFFKEFLKESGVFKSGEIEIDIYREGIDITKYRIISNGDEFVLVFTNPPKVVELIHSKDKEELKKWAVTLSCFLYYLNTKSEVVYVLENNLFKKPDLSVSFVFAAHGSRFSSISFQEKVIQLVRSLLPAHLYLRVYWLKDTMESFENAYKKWTDALLKNEIEKFDEIEKEIDRILNPNL